MKLRILVISLIGLAALGLWLAPAPARASRDLQDATGTPPPTDGSCLSLPPDQQTGCFATKVANEELLRQTQEVVGTTATAQAVEQQIQGTLAAQGATPTPVPTVAVPQATPQGFSVNVPGLDIKLNLLSIAGLSVCAAGGIVLIILGIYLVRGSGDEEEAEALPVVGAAPVDTMPEVRPLFTREPEPARMMPSPIPPVPAAPPEGKTSPAPSPLEAVIAGAPGALPVLVFSDGLQVPVTSGDFSIGRTAANDFVVDSRFPGFENVSAEHARLVQDATGRWLIEDLGSANGTYVNDRPTTMNVLRDGWRVNLASVQFTFRLPATEDHK